MTPDQYAASRLKNRYKDLVDETPPPPPTCDEWHRSFTGPPPGDPSVAINNDVLNQRKRRRLHRAAARVAQEKCEHKAQLVEVERRRQAKAAAALLRLAEEDRILQAKLRLEAQAQAVEEQRLRDNATRAARLQATLSTLKLKAEKTRLEALERETAIQAELDELLPATTGHDATLSDDSDESDASSASEDETTEENKTPTREYSSSEEDETPSEARESSSSTPVPLTTCGEDCVPGDPTATPDESKSERKAQTQFSDRGGNPVEETSQKSDFRTGPATGSVHALRKARNHRRKKKKPSTSTPPSSLSNGTLLKKPRVGPLKWSGKRTSSIVRNLPKTQT